MPSCAVDLKAITVRRGLRVAQWLDLNNHERQSAFSTTIPFRALHFAQGPKKSLRPQVSRTMPATSNVANYRILNALHSLTQLDQIVSPSPIGLSF